MYDLAILVIVLLFSLPVFAYSAYTIVLLAGSFSYRPPSSSSSGEPAISVLLASFNEERVMGQTLQAIDSLGLPDGRLQVVLADDSTDGTVALIDRWADQARSHGIDVIVSRRPDRRGFKAGALNEAAKRLTGDLVLLMDADSRISRDALDAGIEAIDGGLSFVSFRVGHYNREENLVTRSFALFQDTVDGLQKMGSSRLSLPFSVQGGFVLARREALSGSGYWREGALAEDADLSCKLFARGFTGAYLSGAQLLSEDPSSLRVWKRQAARVAQGWAQCLRGNFRTVIGSKRLGPLKKAGLLLTLLSPFAGLSWIVVTLMTAIAIVAGVINPASSVFSNAAYVVAVSVPVVVFYIAGLHALSIRRMLSPRNVVLLPVLSYMVSATFTISAISFVRGLAGARGDFFRTPKKGGAADLDIAGQRGEGRGVRAVEGGLSVVAVVVSAPTFFAGQLLLGASLLAFGLVTLKSMELSKSIRGVEGT